MKAAAWCIAAIALQLVVLAWWANGAPGATLLTSFVGSLLGGFAFHAIAALAFRRMQRRRAAAAEESYREFAKAAAEFAARFGEEQEREGERLS